MGAPVLPIIILALLFFLAPVLHAAADPLPNNLTALSLHHNDPMLRIIKAQHTDSTVWRPLLEIGSFNLSTSADSHTWPALELNWRVVLGSILGFLGAAFGSIGGVGGGGIFVPLLCLIVGFDQKSSAALSKCMIMGASAATVWYNFRLKHPTQNTSLIDYDLALIFQPMLMLGISIGVHFNVIFPNWLVTILLIILFTVTSSMSFAKGVKFWKEETIQKRLKKENDTLKVQCEEGSRDGDYVAIPEEPNDIASSIWALINWSVISALIFVWVCFLSLQILKTHSTTCSVWYWVWDLLQLPVAFGVYLKAAFSLYNKSKVSDNKDNFVCSAEIHWKPYQLFLCALASITAGIVGGLLGLGGGFILSPLFLEIGVPPVISSATATFVMLFSSSMSVIEYYLIHRFPVPFALYLCSLSIVAGFWAQHVVRKLVMLLGRASVIVFMLSTVIFLSALLLGGFGIQDTIIRWQRHEYMGFLNLCSS